MVSIRMAEFSNPAAYELWMGRWSRLLAPPFVAFASITPGQRVLDVGSGTGSLSLALLELADASFVVGIEPVDAYVSYSRERHSDRRLRFEVGDALDIPFEANSFDSTLSMLILQELPDAPLALREMRRVTRPGGVVAACQWDFAKAMPMLTLFWEAASEVIGDERTRRAAEECMAVAYPDDMAMQGLWQQSGLVDVTTRNLAIQMHFRSFDDYWQPFLSNVTPTSSFAASLDAAARGKIQERLRDKISMLAPASSFQLEARAWAVRGVEPSR